MKTINVRKVLYFFSSGFSIFKENRLLKTKLQDIAKYRNELLGIIVANSHIDNVMNQGEPLFITTKSTTHFMVFNIYDYSPAKLASAKVTLNAGPLQSFDIEIPEHTPADLKAILLTHIEREGKRLKIISSL